MGDEKCLFSQSSIELLVFIRNFIPILATLRAD